MGVIRYIGDKLANLVANLGTERDKAAHNFYTLPMVTDEQLIAAYRGAWLPRKIVDIPALDACRKWRDWQADADQITKIEAEERRLGLQKKVMEAMTKARLFGGAAIYIGTGDPDPSKPVGENAKVKHLTVLNRRQLSPGEIDIDPDSPRFGKPAWYQLTTRAVQTIHPSRLVVFIGSPLPDEELATGLEFGWGDSVLTSVFEAVSQADGTTANIASLIFEAKVDVIRVPDFMASLQDPQYEKLLLERFRLAAMQKGINGALVLDKEEEYEQKSANFSNLKDIMLAFMQVVSGAADIPMTRLLGQSPGGLQATGDADTRNYYDRISAHQELEMRPALETLDNLIIRQALGTRPPDIWYRWSSLWQTTDKEQSEIGKATADMIKTIADTKLIPDDALSQAAINVLTERGVMPGLEQAVADVNGFDDGEDDTSAIGKSRRPVGDYDPSQPRVSAGNPNGGQWAGNQGGGGLAVMPEIPDGHLRVYHGSPKNDLDEVKDTGLFGGIFASGDQAAASSHETQEGDLYYADIKQSDVLTQYKLEYETPYENQVAALKKSASWVDDDDDFEELYDVVINQRDVWNKDEDQMLRIFPATDLSEASFEGQRIRGAVAKQLGYKAVEMEDEHGTSYLLLPGVKVSKVVR